VEGQAVQIVCSRCSHILEYSTTRPSFCSNCGQALTETISAPAAHDPEAPTLIPKDGPGEEAPTMPRTLGGYRLRRQLGAGGMGAVYEAEEIATGRRVALKVIGAEYTGTPDAVERFRQEGRLASMLTHPRCVFVLAVDEEAGRPYIVMELMPGSTLKDLVDQQGPLAPDVAVAKILDVIEGLQEAHRLEIIHRDVKPSNCFLEADGRVKVGDFGLAKSLVHDASHLTQKGAFLGTLFFASPEQIRGEAVDPQTDVYSVAATLYYLLIGKAPFQSSDAAATLARIVADPPPRLRSMRPELSPALERVVLRGLEREREQRWPDLESFKQALLALTPAPLDHDSQGTRLAAYLVDFLLVWLITQAIVVLLSNLLYRGAYEPNYAWALALGKLAGLALFIAYFALLERLWGCSLAKWLFGLRVGTVSGPDRPRWAQTIGRTVCLAAWTQLGFLISALLSVPYPWDNLDWDITATPFALICSWSWWLLGAALVVFPMRAANGYQGLHEIPSGTRVYRLYRPRPRRTLFDTGGWLLSFLGHRRLRQGSAGHSKLPECIAGFTIRGALKWTPDEKILLGEDASVGRKVFIWLRPSSAPPLDRPRREVGRRSRLRWLAAGKQGDLQWDAILAPSGCPLPELVHSEGKLPWKEARPLFEALTDELAAACADGTLPGSLNPAQVWVQPDGRAQLADTALTEGAQEQAGAEGCTDQERALALLRQVADLVMEGRPPNPAGRVVDRLTTGKPPYETVLQFQADLAAHREAATR
jgi:hypothetical protein